MLTSSVDLLRTEFETTAQSFGRPTLGSKFHKSLWATELSKAGMLPHRSDSTRVFHRVYSKL